VAWALAVLLLAVVVGVILRLGELEELVRLLRGLRAEWLLAGMALQAGTYVCAAGVWQLALAAQGQRFPVRALVPVALAMLFTNQAFPSAGLAGSVVVVRALGRRRVPGPIAMGALLVGLTTQYHASLVGSPSRCPSCARATRWTCASSPRPGRPGWPPSACRRSCCGSGEPGPRRCCPGRSAPGDSRPCRV
jgi:hypothetical protein